MDFQVFSTLKNGQIKFFCVDGLCENGDLFYYHLNNKEKFCWDQQYEPEVSNLIPLKNIYNFYGLDNLSHCNILSSKEEEEFKEISNKINNIIASFRQFNTKDLCIYDLVPKKIVYDFLKKKVKLLNSLKERIDLLEKSSLIYSFFKDNNDLKVLKRLNFDIETAYDIEKVSFQYAANFRFKINEGALNLLNSKPEKRAILIPQDNNSFIYSLDFKQFEFRTFLELSDTKKNFNSDNYYQEIKEKTSQDKERVIAFLYGEKNKKLEEVISRKKILDEIDQDLVYFYKNYPVLLKKDKSDGQMNHTIIQTISCYIFIEKLSKILDLLENRLSKFLYCIHDSMYFSISKSELELVSKINQIADDEVYQTRKYIGKDGFNLVEFNP